MQTIAQLENHKHIDQLIESNKKQKYMMLNNIKDYINHIDESLERLEETKQETVKNINRVKEHDALLGQILQLKYIDKKTNEVVAEEMNYSVRQYINLHNDAIKLYEEIHSESFELKR